MVRVCHTKQACSERHRSVYIFIPRETLNPFQSSSFVASATGDWVYVSVTLIETITGKLPWKKKKQTVCLNLFDSTVSVLAGATLPCWGQASFQGHPRKKNGSSKDSFGLVCSLQGASASRRLHDFSNICRIICAHKACPPAVIHSVYMIFICYMIRM